MQQQDPSDPQDKTNEIEILTACEHVRRRPKMYLSSLDSHGLHELLWHLLGGLIFHYRRFNQSPERIRVCLEPNGRVNITVKGVFLAVDLRKNWEVALKRLPTGPVWGSSLCIVNALGERLSVTIREHDQWHILLFERGILLSIESDVNPKDKESDLSFRLWPDFTILSQATFDSEQTQEIIRTISQENPTVAITLVKEDGE